jgi:hypothetical protein
MSIARHVAAAAVSVILCGHGVAPAAPLQSAPTLRIRLQGKARMAVEDAVRLALQRLAHPVCRQVLAAFRDRTGQPVELRLSASGRSIAEHMATVYFVDGDDSSQCRLNDATTAYSEPDSQVVHVCGRRFAEAFARRPAAGAILVIHEVLHTLGLPENPPTPAQITDTVRRLCDSH